MMTGNLAGFYVQTLRAMLAGLDAPTYEELAATDKEVRDALAAHGTHPQVAEQCADRLTDALVAFGRDVQNLRESADYLIKSRKAVQEELYREEGTRENG